jgi:hypothetical protein
MSTIKEIENPNALSINTQKPQTVVVCGKKAKTGLDAQTAASAHRLVGSICAAGLIKSK